MGSGFVPPHNLQAEEQLLGALMVAPNMVRAVVLEVGLRREHFYSDKHRLIYATIQELAARREPIDALTVITRLGPHLDKAGGRDYVSSLASTVAVPANAVHYARLVLEAANLRAKVTGAQLVLRGVEQRDDTVIQEGIETLTRDVVADHEPSEPHEVRDELLEYLRSEGEPEVFRLPWDGLNDLIGAGGYLRGEFSLLVGWTNLGKSIALDQMLAHFHRQGKRVHLFTTEMSRLERAMRWVQAQTGIPYAKLARRELTDRQRAQVEEAVAEFPFGIRSAEGWTVDRIVQEIAARDVDVAAIDPLNLIRWPGNVSRTAWYDDVLERLKATAVRANCHIVGVAQLNMARAKEENPPEPTLRDIRDSGTAQYIATHILALHREHRSGEPTRKASLRFLKVRNGVRGGIDAEFNPKRLAFEEARPAPKPAQAAINVPDPEPFGFADDELLYDG